MDNEPKDQPNAFASWYQRNKDTFNAKRRQKYRENAAYKQRVLNQSAKTRQERRSRVPRPSQYTHSLTDLAETLDVTIWTLRNWMKNEYLPEPYKFNGELWFTEAQVELLGRIKQYLTTNNIKRLSAEQKIELNKIVGLVHAHWV